MPSFPKELESVYSRIMLDAARIANRDIRNEFGKRHFLGLGWHPFRPNYKSATGLGFTMSNVDAHRLQDYEELVNRITTNAMQQAIMKHKTKFFTYVLQDALVNPQEESFFDPPKYDPRVKRFRNVYGRFSKRKWQ